MNVSVNVKIIQVHFWKPLRSYSVKVTG